jgi:hypothetical protein
MTIRLELLESNFEIEKKINESIAKELNILLNKNYKKVQSQIQFALNDWIRSQPEIKSLLQEGVPNSLHAQLGLISGQGLLSASDIVNAVVSSLEVELIQFNNKLQGGVNFYVQKDDFKNLLGLSSGFSPSENLPLHWLKWLLFDGSSTVVYGYTYVPDFSGRSGGGIMRSGGAWRIPIEFAGTQDDNFITRALVNRNNELDGFLRGIFE